MTINSIDKFMRSLPAAFDGVFNWDYLLPAFKGSKIEPTDIDAVVERKGQFLIFETKDIGKKIPLGQAITMRELLKLNHIRKQTFTIYCIEGKSWNNVTRFACYEAPDGAGWEVSGECVTALFVLAMTRRWYLRADGGQWEEDPWWADYDEVMREAPPRSECMLPG